MPIPKQVIEQEKQIDTMIAAEAEKIAQSSQPGTLPDAPEVPPVVVPVEDVVPVVPPAVTEPVALPPEAGTTAEPAAPAAQPVVPAEPEPAKTPEQIAAAYKTLQGKYNAEVPRQAQELSLLKGSNKLLEQQLALLQQQLASGTLPNNGVPSPQAPPAPPAAPVPQSPAAAVKLSDYYSEEQIEEFGEDYLNMQLQASQRLFSQQSKPLQDGLVQQRQDSTHGMVQALVPNFDSIDRDPAFRAWLNQQIPLAGITRTQALGEQFRSGNAAAVAEFYRQFSAQSAAPAPVPVQQAPTPVPGAVIPAVSAQVTPRTTAPPPPTQQPRKKFYFVSEFQRITTDLTTGKYTPEDRKKLQHEMDRAIAEGRIVPDGAAIPA